MKMEEELMKMVWKIKTDELDFTEWKSSLTPAMKGAGGPEGNASNETLISSMCYHYSLTTATSWLKLLDPLHMLSTGSATLNLVSMSVDKF